MKLAIACGNTQNLDRLVRISTEQSNWDISWVAESTDKALHMSQSLDYDILLIDILLPGKKCDALIKEILQHNRGIILVLVPDLTSERQLVFESITAGALEAIQFPANNPPSIEKFIEHIQKVKRYFLNNEFIPAVKSQEKPSGFVRAIAAMEDAKKWDKIHLKYNINLIAIGCSTGGPSALVSLLSQLPENFNAAIVVIQHVAESHAQDLAQWLDQQINLPVKAINEGDELCTGTVFIARTNDHLVINNRGRLVYRIDPVNNPYRPSVNEFFGSVALNWSGSVIAVLLTGMGSDGGRGLLALRRLGYTTISQEESSCAIYGMPREAARLGAAMEILSPSAIGRHLVHLIEQRTSASSPDQTIGNGIL